ncbi:hypothetical protein SLH46_11255 [Draconibacterium sp. IB214405]|uniref:hypothetical protein n=1 Tax=Draconibacterium sp. IB214405 TaxID=3097352 RepID=UPI002A16DD8C|nr:hypothetical protein [Draconibacterium sp. IB214405]MDX8339764.1 hypothetical protein [Draconibacterium sp. IB214405]
MRELNYTGDDFAAFIEELIDSHRFSDSKEEGIARLVVDKGFEALSDKQGYVFENSIDPYVVSECKRCGCEVPWCEMSAVEFNGGLCSWCWQLSSKDD